MWCYWPSTPGRPNTRDHAGLVHRPIVKAYFGTLGLEGHEGCFLQLHWPFRDLEGDKEACLSTLTSIPLSGGVASFRRNLLLRGGEMRGSSVHHTKTPLPLRLLP
jgi:hypothetical protein